MAVHVDSHSCGTAAARPNRSKVGSFETGLIGVALSVAASNLAMTPPVIQIEAFKNLRACTHQAKLVAPTSALGIAMQAHVTDAQRRAHLAGSMVSCANQVVELLSKLESHANKARDQWQAIVTRMRWETTHALRACSSSSLLQVQSSTLQLHLQPPDHPP